MTAPYVAAAWLGAAFLMGAALGIFYAFLRPLGRRRQTLADGIFLLAAAMAWAELGFGVCGGDLRLGYFFGMMLGLWACLASLGRLLQGVFEGMWRIFGRILGFFLLPAKKILKFLKILFASAKKWGTIK